MRHFEPCLCGADDCPACYPGRVTRRPRYGLSAEDCDILNAEYYAEQAAADEEAELQYRRMLEDDDDTRYAEQAAADAEAELVYRRMLEDEDDTPPVAHELF